jgi:hypothetical protein
MVNYGANIILTDCILSGCALSYVGSTLTMGAGQTLTITPSNGYGVSVASDVALRTADGLPLGEPVRLSVHSNAYGQVLFFITLSVGAVLVALAGRRLWHRFRGQPDQADLDRPRRSGRGGDEPEPRSDPLDVAIAHAPETP